MASIETKLKAYRLPPPVDRDGRIHVSYYPTVFIDEAIAEIERLRKLTRLKEQLSI